MENRTKTLEYKEFLETYRENEELILYDVSPFCSIKDPREILVCGAHYNPSVGLVDITGTFYTLIPDYSNRQIKFYEYYLNGSSIKTGTIREVEKCDIPSHHINNINEIPWYITEKLSSNKIIKIKDILK